MIRRWRGLKGSQKGYVWEWDTDTHLGGPELSTRRAVTQPASIAAWEQVTGHNEVWEEITDHELLLDGGL